MRVPSFPFLGGKVRLRDWIVPFFPRYGRRYIEPFAGRGNVFFEATRCLAFKRWELYDRDASFLKALRLLDCDLLPTTVTREEFEHWKTPDCNTGIVLQAAITFSGGGRGYQHGGYDYFKFRKTCEKAKVFLCNVSIEEQLWDSFKFDTLTEEDFIYFDPPYYNSTGLNYPNIDHFKFCKTVSELPCRWVVSGYPSTLYDRNLKHKRLFQQERRSSGRQLSLSQKTVTECLWMNY